MLNIPAAMQPTLDRWKATHSLGEGTRFSGGFSTSAGYEELMDKVVSLDNGPEDADSTPGLVVCKDDGETHRFTGSSKAGTDEAVTADGMVVALAFDEKSVEHLQLTPKNGGVEALHEHFDRATGKSWMQIGGAVTVINMDEPGALDQIFSKLETPSLTPAQQAVVNDLAGRLGQPVQMLSCEHKGFNAGDCGFPVSGELQMSAWTEGLEIKLQAGEEMLVYRGLDEKSGRFGLDVAHEGYWEQDDKGIYRPDPQAAQEFGW